MSAKSVDAATVLITGAHRGLGLEFARQYAARGAAVIATCRQPDNATVLKQLAAHNPRVQIETLDVTDDATIRSLAARLQGRPIDLLINNAGILGQREDQTLGSFSRAGFRSVMDVNVFGVLAVSEALRENVIAGTQKKIIAISSGLGSVSIVQHVATIPYSYCISKAALNMAMAALGSELKSHGVVAAVLSPGAVDTDMLASARAEYGLPVQPITASESVSKMMLVIDALDQTTAATGIHSYDGSVRPW